jgi:flavin-dependent dehydrogenase
LEAEATRVSFVDDRVIVGTTAGPVEAKNLVIATGSPAWVARVTGQRPVTMDSLICYWARLAVPIESRLLHVETTASGWWYVCPGEASTTLACFLTDAEGSRQIARSESARWNTLFQDTRLCRQYALNARAGQIHCLPVNVAAVACRCGSQWVAAGDAAIKLDPVGSSGTATALESGVLGARALLASRQGNKAAAERYDRWGNGLLAEFLKRRTPLYVAEAHKFPDGFWTRRASSCLGFDAKQLQA